MQVVIPMSGTGERFRAAGYRAPKPLIEVDGQPVIAHLLEKFPKDWDFVFVCNRDHLRGTRLRRVLTALSPRAAIVPIPPHKLGPVHAVLLAADAIADDEPTIVSYCDFNFVWDSDHFARFVERTRCDGAIVCYRGFHPHYLRPTMYAYCRAHRGRVLEVREKGHFTADRTMEAASSGTYYFRSGRLMKKYFREAMRRDLSVDGEYYVSLVFNPMIDAGLHVRVYEIPVFLQWGTPDDLEDYRYWARTFRCWNRREAQASPRSASAAAPRLLMPMAGHGRRFAGTNLPKALTPVLGAPMFAAAMERLPASEAAPVLVTLETLAPPVRAQAPHADLVPLARATEGQAVTCLAAEARLDVGRPVLVSSCDHGLLWDARKWAAALARVPDVLVIGQRGYPGASRTPTQFAYIETLARGSRIRRVSVKTPISDTPRDDLLLVGTFYFRTAGLLFDLVRELVRRDLRVDGELYLDSVVNLAIEAGRDVRCFEADAYLCWGSPDALREFEYWYSYFQADLAVRPTPGGW